MDKVETNFSYPFNEISIACCQGCPEFPQRELLSSRPLPPTQMSEGHFQLKFEKPNVAISKLFYFRQTVLCNACRYFREVWLSKNLSLKRHLVSTLSMPLVAAPSLAFFVRDTEIKWAYKHRFHVSATTGQA